MRAEVGPVPALAVAAAVLYAAACWLQDRTTFGHYVYALSGTLSAGAGVLLGWTDRRRQIARGALLIGGVAAVVWTRRPGAAADREGRDHEGI